MAFAQAAQEVSVADPHLGWWGPVAGAAGGGVAVLVAGFFKRIRSSGGLAFDHLDRWVKGWGRSKTVMTSMDAMLFTERLRACLERAKAIPNLHRVGLFTGRNCGGLPVENKPYTVRCLMGWSQPDDPEPPHERFHDEIQMDRQYARMILTLHQDGYYLFDTAKEQPGILKGIYERANSESKGRGIKESHIYRLAQDEEKNQLGYMSLATFGRPFTENEKGELNLFVNEVRTIIDSAGRQS